MVKFFHLIVIIFFCNSLYSQINFREHLNSIKSVYYESYIMGDSINVNEEAINFAMKKLREKSIATNFITNKKLLNKLNNCIKVNASATNVYISETLKNGTHIEVELTFKNFEGNKNKIEKRNNLTYVNNKKAYGSLGFIPSVEIDSLEISVDGNRVLIPKTAYQNLYEVEFNDKSKSIEIYSSIDGEYIFIYFIGGQASETYYAKLIFNKERYITQIIADYGCLFKWQAFKSDKFIGF